MDSHLSLAGLIIAILAVWRLAHLLWGEDGPWEVFVRFRKVVGNGFWGKLLDCFYCVSLWVALPFALWVGTTWPERFIFWLAFSGGAILLERMTPKEI
jgi:hypothetical protein